jgi:uncharacterized protein YnzC (UPF0291/DUF896 family)
MMTCSKNKESIERMMESQKEVVVEENEEKQKLIENYLSRKLDNLNQNIREYMVIDED